MCAPVASRHRLPEGEERNPIFNQILAQPHSFRLVGVKGHVHAAAVIESEGAMHGGFTHGGDRKRLGETRLESGFDPLEHRLAEKTVAVEALRDLPFGQSPRGPRRQCRFGLGLLRDLARQARARFGEIALFAREFEIPKDRVEREPRRHPRFHQMRGRIKCFLARFDLRPAAATSSSASDSVRSCW